MHRTGVGHEPEHMMMGASPKAAIESESRAPSIGLRRLVILELGGFLGGHLRVDFVDRPPESLPTRAIASGGNWLVLSRSRAIGRQIGFDERFPYLFAVQVDQSLHARALAGAICASVSATLSSGGPITASFST